MMPPWKGKRRANLASLATKNLRRAPAGRMLQDGMEMFDSDTPRGNGAEADQGLDSAKYKSASQDLSET